jgi:hypothetical protein
LTVTVAAKKQASSVARMIDLRAARMRRNWSRRIGTFV